MILTIRLPLPPTINHYYGVNKKTGARYIESPGAKYRKDIGWLMKRKHQFGGARLELTVVWHFRGERGDFDNRIKPLCDALQHAGTYNNDQQIRRAHIEIGHPVKGGAVDITLEEI